MTGDRPIQVCFRRTQFMFCFVRHYAVSALIACGRIQPECSSEEFTLLNWTPHPVWWRSTARHSMRRIDEFLTECQNP
jgi:hypothetical protein